ncbi:MAG: right-handed parallel beta-helix repeat-containing protein [Cyclobacteriaceae bacterium]|nr:right-handed parallel beta-helix repeat-containing protein [Cyclobacteriaceae bacterium]MDH4295165.1 right-handed parallel beta-helix repeat-containing protein [Cyclobacteriaceae bacterium]MDH5250345.1 right-handed parallel beta-helix repeat-containing protein [Cyclobacteriaceae bacterium]
MRLLLSFLLLTNVCVAQEGKFTVDALVSPKTKERIISVGGPTADMPGNTNEAIQRAVDALPAEGGTVKMDPGQYNIMAPVRLPSNVKLIGSGPETILVRIDGFHTKFIIDADFGELKLTVDDASGFAVGMSIQVTDDVNADCWDVTTGIITDIVGNVIYIDTHLIRDYDSEQNGKVTNAGSCVSVFGAQNVFVSNFTIDGNKANNDRLDGCNGGGVVIMKSRNVTVENVHVKDFNGEGITWQITENVTVRNCEINGCTNMGMHPGTGSPNSIIEGNNSHDNKVGLYLCWRVQHSVVSGNELHHNQEIGISTGHKDSDVLFEKNHIYENGGDGVYFRYEDQKNSPHRNTFSNNTVENNGTVKGGYGFSFYGNATDVVLKDNIIRDTKNGSQKAAIFISKSSPVVKTENNRMSGHTLGNVIQE